MIRTLVYISNAVKLIEDIQLEKLFHEKIVNNTFHNITGILLYKEGTFIQILEEDCESKFALTEYIKSDNHHNNITKLLDKRIESRIFSNFRAASLNGSNSREIEMLENVLKNNENPHSQMILSLLHPFLNKCYPSLYYDSCQTL